MSNRRASSKQSELAVLISNLQVNSNQVDENITRAEKLLKEDIQKGKKGSTLTRRLEIADNLAGTELLLKDLFMDVDKVKQLQHPQANEIELDVNELHNRWSQSCDKYHDLYDQSLDLNLPSNVDWAQQLSKKLMQIKQGAYGPSLSDVEKQMASHNILHKEIESYGPQLDSAELKSQFKRLMEESLSRRQYLSGLYDYLSRCSKETSYLTEQQNRIRKTDWSDLIRDSSGVRLEHERLMKTSLPPHEREVTKLREEAESLLDVNHPGWNTIRKYNEEVLNEWQRFLNLCNCQETHLKNVDLYKKYQLDSEMIAESLKRVNSTMEPSLLSSMSNSQILMQLEGEERAIQRNERRLNELRDFCTDISPLPLRRTQNTRSTVVALCDWTEDENTVRQGEKCTLMSNPREELWEVKDRQGVTKHIPGAIFVIPPPDSDAIERVEGLEQDFASLKRRRASLLASVRSPTQEIVHVTKTVSVSSVPDSPSGSLLNSRLDQLIADLLHLEKEVLERLRAPLKRDNHIGDLTIRIREHEKAVANLRSLEETKKSIQKEIESTLSRSSKTPDTSLPPKLSTAQNKIEDLNTLTDLYGQKTKTVMSLEKQINHVDSELNELEEQLNKDTVVFEKTFALQDHKGMLEQTQAESTEKKAAIQKLNNNLESTEQLVGHLQKGFQEYCPDIHWQKTEVKNLRNRYANINNQLQQRLDLMNEAEHKYQTFHNSVSSLNIFLNDIPDNKIHSGDAISQVNIKHASQKRIVEELKRKSEDVDQILKLSRELQSILKEYETITYKYRATIGDTDLRKLHNLTFAEALQNKERNIVKLYYEVLGENVQLYDKMRLSRTLVNKNETVVNRVVVYQQREQEDVENLKKELSDEISRRIHIEKDLETYRSRMMSLRSRRGVERVEEKETVHYYRDSKLEADIEIMKRKTEEEVLKHSGIHAEIELVNKKIINLEHEVVTIIPKLITKVTTEIARDPKLEKEVVFIREEMHRLMEEIRIRETEIRQYITEITVLEKRTQVIKERVVFKEVVRIEKDPEMLRAVIKFKEELSAISISSKSLSDEVFHLRSQINSLERVIPTIQPKIVIQEVRKVEQDAELLREVNILRSSLEEIRQEMTILLREISTLQVSFTHIEKVTQKIEVRETVNEIYRIDPDTEREIRRLRTEIQRWLTMRDEFEQKISVVIIDVKTLRVEKPRVEIQESIHEIIKEERSPEVVKELARLKEQLIQIQATYSATLNKLTVLRTERDEWKVQKSKVETQIVTKEFITHVKDPLIEKEAEKLRLQLQEELRLTRLVEVNIYDLRQKFVTLETQKHQEKIVYKEVVVLQKDQNQIIEHERLSRRLQEATKARHAIEIEVQKLRALILEKEKSLNFTEVRTEKVRIESELKLIRSRILEIETTPAQEKIIIEEVTKVERDPNLDRQMSSLQIEIANESKRMATLKQELHTLKTRIEVLTKEKSIERIVHKEVIRYEKDRSLDAELSRLREQLTQVRIARKNQEEEIQRVQTKVTHIQTTVTSYTQEETTITRSLTLLKTEREELLVQLRRLETELKEIRIRYQHESKLISEMSQSNKQRYLTLETEIQSLERSILIEKESIKKKEIIIIELQNNLRKEEQSEQTRGASKSKRFSIFDPETGKDLSPYDAYVQGLIDKNQYLHLQSRECSWEEITTTGTDGEKTVLLDRKSGKTFSLEEALLHGRLTQYDVDQYKAGKISIYEFALMVAGEKSVTSNDSFILPPSTPVKSSSSSSLFDYSTSSRTSLRKSFSSENIHSSGTLYGAADETFPICGVLDTTTKTRMSVRSAMTRNLIDPSTAQKLLEAQAATGGLVDITKRERYSIHKAADRGLIDTKQMSKLIGAQKAFTGFENPTSKDQNKDRLSVWQAAQRSLIPKENAMRYLEVQHLTGGLVDPNRPGRLTLQGAVNEKIIDQQTANELEDSHNHLKDLIDPGTKSILTYKQAMALCKKDESTGLLLWPVASNDTVDAPSSYRKSSYSYSFSTSSLPR